MANQLALLAAQGIARAAGAVTGVTPQVVDHGTYYDIAWTKPADQIRMRQWLRQQINAPAGKDQVRINYMPVVAPLALEYLLPAAVGLALLGFVAGHYLGRRRAREVILK